MPYLLEVKYIRSADAEKFSRRACLSYRTDIFLQTNHLKQTIHCQARDALDNRNNNDLLSVLLRGIECARPKFRQPNTSA